MLRILKLHLYLFMWYQAAETLSDLATRLAENVTINCELDDASEVTWLLLNLPDPPVVILHSFLNPPTTFYYKKTFRHKYSVKSSHRLFINSIAMEELGVYYCMDKETTVKFSNGTRLDIIYPTQSTKPTVCKNSTAVELNTLPTLWQIVTLLFGLISAFVVILVTVFVIIFKCFCCWK